MMNEPVRVLQWGMTEGLGGLETFMMNVYRHIDRSKVQFDFLQSHDAGPLVYERDIERLGGRVYRVMYSERESLIRSRTCLADFFKEHPGYAAVHVNANFPYAFPLKYAKRAGVPLRILHSHNIGSAARHDQGNFLRRMMWQARTAKVGHEIDVYPNRYLACSDMAADYMFPGKSYTWVRNGIETDRFAFDGEERKRTRDEFGIGDDTTVIGFCGNFREQKNPVFVVEIFAEYVKVNATSILLMVGDGRLRSQTEHRAEELGIGSKVKFLGVRDDMNRLYQAMDAFVLPSRFEGLGIVYVEAQCAGLPCLASADVVPQAAKVTDLLDFVPLEDTAYQWAERLRRSLEVHTTRVGRAGDVRAAGYDIQDVADRLQCLYLSSGVTSNDVQ